MHPKKVLRSQHHFNQMNSIIIIEFKNEFRPDFSTEDFRKDHKISTNSEQIWNVIHRRSKLKLLTYSLVFKFVYRNYERSSRFHGWNENSILCLVCWCPCNCYRSSRRRVHSFNIKIMHGKGSCL